MNAYIQVNMEIQQKSFKNVTQMTSSHSIDEGFTDLTSSLNYFFIPDPARPTPAGIFLLDPKRIWQQTGIYVTVGMSNANPLLAKLVLTTKPSTRKPWANWSYEDASSVVPGR